MREHNFLSKQVVFLVLLVMGVSVLLSLFLASAQQEIQHEARVINIEVPVRVFKGSAFIYNLGIDDFEVYEDGVLQGIEAVYLIKKTEVAEKLERTKTFYPDISRQFVFVFELNEYLPRIRYVVEEFFSRVFTPGDSLYVITPVKNYNFKKESLTLLNKEKIAEQLVGILRKDLISGNFEYRSAMKHVEEIFALEVDFDLKQSMYLNAARRLKSIKNIDEQNLKVFTDFLRDREGQKHVFIFYQKEMIPILNGIEDTYLIELKKDVSFNIERIRRIFSDSSISVNFLFITNKPAVVGDLDVGRMKPLRVRYMDQSYSVFNAFREVSATTGGIADSSANALASFQKAATAVENYYLIYYSPKDYRPDGKFRKIEVKVKNRRYRVTHRAGYFAD
jgi:VWFA-related protein